MATAKTGKTTKGSRKSQPKYLGLKKFGGESVTSGSILVRQRGNRFRAGSGVATGRDYTLFATTEGVVTYYVRSGKKYVSVAYSA